MTGTERPASASIVVVARRGLTSLRRATTTMDALAGRSVPVTRRLRSAVEAYEATHCSAVHLVADDAADTISEAAGRALVRALQEGLSNVERHAEAQTVEVTLTCDPERAEVRLTVTDDGLGVATDATPGTGLELARSELEAVGGRLELQAVPVGARLVAAVPLDA